MRDRREKTGFYARDGRAIRDGDRVRAIYFEQIITGVVVQEFDSGEWYVECAGGLAPSMWSLDEVEVLK